MKNLIKKLLSFLSINITLLNKKNKLHQLGLNASNSEIFENGQKILLKDFDLITNYNRHQYILQGLSLMYNLKRKHNALFTLDNSEVFTIRINRLTYNIQTFEELFILNEIFINGIYNVSTTKKFALIDIGMNVGLTSLYFAQNPDCLSVYAFEPFKLTFEQALLNLSLNPVIKNKINPFNYGLGNENKSIKVTYDKDIKGNMGINGIPDYLTYQNQEVINEEIVIRDASEILDPILKTLIGQNTSIVLKVDCEGSEYDIFDSFGKSQILQHFNTIIIEWHFKGPEQICTYLKETGYTFFSFDPDNEIAGMIYAFKIPSS